MLKNYSLAWKLIPAYLIIGFLSGYFITNSLYYKFAKVSKPIISSSEVLTAEGNPIKLKIQDLGIDVDVVEGDYLPQTKTWNVSSSYANFASISNLDNTKEGNTVIYGHNSSKIFGKTKDLKVGMQVLVFTGNGYEFIYSFEGSSLVSPSDTSVFSYKGKPILTLITCWGTFNEKRSLMKFNLEKVIKI